MGWKQSQFNKAQMYMYGDDPDAAPFLAQLEASPLVTKGGNKKIVTELGTIVLKVKKQSGEVLPKPTLTLYPKKKEGE